jgi:hypothetical protein
MQIEVKEILVIGVTGIALVTGSIGIAKAYFSKKFAKCEVLDLCKKEFGSINSKLENHENRIDKIEDNSGQFKVFEAEIRTKIDYMQESINDIKGNVSQLINLMNRRREQFTKDNNE